MSEPKYSADDQLRSEMNQYEFDFDPDAMEHFQQMQTAKELNNVARQSQWKRLGWGLALFCLMGGSYWCYNETQAPSVIPHKEKRIAKPQRIDKDLAKAPVEEIKNVVKALPPKKKVEKLESPPVETQKVVKVEDKKEQQEAKKERDMVHLKKTPPPKIPSIPIKLEAVKDIRMIAEGERILLNNIQFESGSPVMISESKKEVQLLLEKLQENPNLEIEISGHLCCAVEIRDGDGYDYDHLTWDLSKNRAKKVYDFLVKKGIEKSRLSYQGMGLKKPLVSPEKNEEDEALNRRVEVKIVKQ